MNLRWAVPIFVICLILTPWRLSAMRQPPAPPGQPAGLQIVRREQAGDSQLVIQSGERFELVLDQGGVSAWYDLRRDPQRAHNLVAAGRRLLEHRIDATAMLGGPPVLLEQSAVRTRVAWQGGGDPSSQPFSVEYTIWAGGQIAIAMHGHQAARTTLHRSDAAITGAALQLYPAVTQDDGTLAQSAMLFLDAWTGEDRLPPQLAAALVPADPATAALAPLYNQQSGAIQAVAPASQAFTLTLPEGVMLRYPRFEISSWPGGELAVARGRTTLVEGHDYLASWDAATQLLSLQYLYPLPASPDASARSFSFAAQAAEPSLSLGVPGRTIDENGLLLVDANMPDRFGTTSASDMFAIPYIQTSPTLDVIATLQNGPAGAGVEFVLVLSDGARQLVRDLAAPYQATFTMRARGEHRLEAYIVDAAGGRVGAAADTIDPLGYGHIFVSIGDSITAGAYGDSVSSGSPGYPVTSYRSSPHYSADRRNIYQYDNKHASSNAFQRGYQVELNSLLTTCARVPVFILNDGLSGLRTASETNNNLVGKQATYNDHIDKLDAQYVLLQIGTNDVSQGLLASSWQEQLNAVVDALQGPNHELGIWIARLPWRSDGGASQTEGYNQYIPEVVSQQHTAANPVWLGPDFYSYFLGHPEQMADRLHPGQAGYNAMAALWSTTACPIVQAPPDSPPATVTPTATRTAAPTATCPPPAGGVSEPASYWPLDEGSASTRPPYQDRAGGNPITTCVSGLCPTPVSGQVGGAQQFSGSGGGLLAPASPSFNWGADASFALALWMRAEAGATCSSGSQVIVGRDDSATSLHWWLGCVKGGASNFALYDTSGAGDTLQGPAVTDGAWHQLVAVRDGAARTTRLYVDGEPVASATRTYSSGFGSPSAGLNLGWLNLDAGYRFQGRVDEVALFGRALSAAEVAELYRLGLAGRGYSQHRLLLPLVSRRPSP